MVMLFFYNGLVRFSVMFLNPCQAAETGNFVEMHVRFIAEPGGQLKKSGPVLTRNWPTLSCEIVVVNSSADFLSGSGFWAGRQPLLLDS